MPAVHSDVKCFCQDMEHCNANAYLTLSRLFVIRAEFIFYYIVNILITSPIGERNITISVSIYVCLSVSVFVCLLAYLKSSSKFHQVFYRPTFMTSVQYMMLNVFVRIWNIAMLMLI